MSENNATNIAFEQSRSSAGMAQNQRAYMQWVNNAEFYALVPAPYHSFYFNWVKTWLDWYDGYVPTIHGGSNGLLSTHIATTIINRSADSIIGGDIMFKDACKPSVYIADDNGRPVSKAKRFIGQWSKDNCFRDVVKKGLRFALAGGFSLLKANCDGKDLWLDTLRADRFFVDINSKGDISKAVCAVSLYEQITKNSEQKRFWLIEERRYERIGIYEEVPIVEYKVYESSSPIQYFSVKDNCVKWEDLPKAVRNAFKSEYGNVRLNAPTKIVGFDNLGVYLFKSEDLGSIPQLNLGQSLLANALTYLYSYDYYFSCFNTDMYLGRGRVLVPKSMKGPQAPNHGTQNTGLDDFLYTQVETQNTDQQKPEPIQFDLRSNDWREIRNNLLESISTTIGQSVSTIASYLTDGSNRTAREVSAEESATALFIENKRANFGHTINAMLKDVLKYYGFVDDVEIRWSKSGMTNLTVLVDNLTKAKQSGLISSEEAHRQFNFDMDDEQLALDFEKVQNDEAKQQNTLFGGYGEQT